MLRTVALLLLACSSCTGTQDVPAPGQSPVSVLEQRVRDDYVRATKWVRANDSPFIISELPLTSLEQAMRSAMGRAEFGIEVVPPARDTKGIAYRCEVRGRGEQMVILAWGCGADELFGTADDECGISVERWADLTPLMPDELVERLWAECGLQRPRRNAPPK